MTKIIQQETKRVTEATLILDDDRFVRIINPDKKQSGMEVDVSEINAFYITEDGYFHIRFNNGEVVRGQLDRVENRIE